MRRWVPRSRQARRLIAFAICALWVLGFEVGPGLHVALHDRLPTHTHIQFADGMVITVTHGVGTHVHADGSVHRNDEPDSTPKRIADGQGHLRTPLDHGAHSLAHHGIAILPLPRVVTTPLPIDRRAYFAATPTLVTPVWRHFGRAVARGPPSARDVA